MHSAPAKIILLGEHAVVYGQPAIAVPFPALNATAHATEAPPGAGLTILARDVGRVLRVHPSDETPDNALTYAAQLTLRALNAPPPDLAIEIRSTIPIGSGFGSGAAVTAALMRSLSAALGRPFDDEQLNDLVFEVEKMHHGTPSGIDNTVVVFGRPVYFVRGQAPEPFGVGRALHFLVCDSGASASTRETVGDVKRLVEAEPERYMPLIEAIGAIVREARGCLEVGDAASLGALMIRDHDLLRELTVSSELLDRLVGAALDAGALGAKLSGGGRGGSMVALVVPGEAGKVAAALREAGAKRLWPMTLEAC